MSPEKFKERMCQIKDKNIDDPEVCHIEMDDLICEVLIDLGYEEGIRIFYSTSKWYA